MACNFPDNCVKYTMAPILVAQCCPTKCSENTNECYVPRSNREACCVKKQPSTKDEVRRERECSPPRCHSPRRYHSPRRCYSPPHSPTRQCCSAHYCSTCCEPDCKPVRTKYVMPCYKYEDGRIEQYVPTRHGRLPTSAYLRNGIQDQVYGYRGARRYLCCAHGRSCTGYCVYTVVEPLQRLYPKITQEILPRNWASPYSPLIRPVFNEFAMGSRMRRKPFVDSAVSVDRLGEVHRYHSEDERGNFCFHYERKKSNLAPTHQLHHNDCYPYHHHHHHHHHRNHPCQPCELSPECQYVDGIHAEVLSPNTCGFYY